MLITKIYLNLGQIDEIWINNIGELRRGVFTYKIERPAGIDDVLIHRRADGYQGLLLQALSAIICHQKGNHGNNKN